MSLIRPLILIAFTVFSHLPLYARQDADSNKPIDTVYVPLSSRVLIGTEDSNTSFANRLYHQLDSILKKETSYGLARMDGRENDKEAVLRWLQKNIEDIGNNAGRASDGERTSTKAELDCGWFCRDAAFTFTLAFATVSSPDAAAKQSTTHKRLETADHIYAYTGYYERMLIDVSLNLPGKGKTVTFRMPGEGILYQEDNIRIRKEMGRTN